MDKQKHEFIEEMQTRLDQLDAKTDELEARARGAAIEVRREAEREMKAIKQSKAAAERKLEVLGEATDDAWYELKQGAELAWRSLATSVENAAKRFQ